MPVVVALLVRRVISSVRFFHYNYAWKFGDGEVANAVSVRHTCQFPGVCNAILTAPTPTTCPVPQTSKYTLLSLRLVATVHNPAVATWLSGISGTSVVKMNDNIPRIRIWIVVGVSAALLLVLFASFIDLMIWPV